MVYMEASRSMRILALLLMCLIVALLSGLALFWSITSKTHEIWLDVLFVIAIVLTLGSALSLIKRAASDSLFSSYSSERKRKRNAHQRQTDS